MTNLSSARPARQIRKTRAIAKKEASIYLPDEALSTSRTPGAKEFRTICRPVFPGLRSEEHTSELQSQSNLVCRLLLEKKKTSLSTLDPRQPPHRSETS